MALPLADPTSVELSPPAAEPARKRTAFEESPEAGFASKVAKVAHKLAAAGTKQTDGAAPHLSLIDKLSTTTRVNPRTVKGVKIVAGGPDVLPAQSATAPQQRIAGGPPAATLALWQGRSASDCTPRARTKAAMLVAKRDVQVSATITNAASPPGLSGAGALSNRERAAAQDTPQGADAKVKGAAPADEGPGVVSAGVPPAQEPGSELQRQGPAVKRDAEAAVSSIAVLTCLSAAPAVSPVEPAIDTAPASCADAACAACADESLGAAATCSRVAAAIASAAATAAGMPATSSAAFPSQRNETAVHRAPSAAPATSSPDGPTCSQPAGDAAPVPAEGGEQSVPLPPKPRPETGGGHELRYSVAVGPEDLAFRDAIIASYRQHYQAAKREGVCPLHPNPHVPWSCSAVTPVHLQLLTVHAVSSTTVRAYVQIAKPDMRATSIMKKAKEVPPRCLGHPRGVKPGDRVEGRGELDALAVHNLAVQGIDCVRGAPAFAICMSGGYVDDEDTGTTVWYTGMGGQSGKRQARDQELRSVRINSALHLCDPAWHERVGDAPTVRRATSRCLRRMT